MTKTILTLALSLGLFSGLSHAAEQPLKVGTTAAFAIPQRHAGAGFRRTHL